MKSNFIKLSITLIALGIFTISNSIPTQTVAADAGAAQPAGDLQAAPPNDSTPADLLAALEAAKRKAQRINCVNNLKQIGLAFKIWEGDNNDQYPFNLSTNKGGTMELCDTGANGLDRNSWQHLLVMSNVLATPKILACPADAQHPAALDFSQFGADHCTYLIQTGTNINDSYPQAVLAICPLHRNVLYCDGSVQQLSQAKMDELMAQLAQKK